MRTTMAIMKLTMAMAVAVAAVTTAMMMMDESAQDLSIPSLRGGVVGVGVGVVVRGGGSSRSVCGEGGRQLASWAAAARLVPEGTAFGHDTQICLNPCLID